MRAPRAGIDDGLLDRQDLATGPGGEHREMPDVRVVGRIEPHDQPPPLPRHRTPPPLEPRRDVARQPRGCVERAAVEATEEGLRHVGRGPDGGRRCRRLELAGTVAADRVDHPGERGPGQGAGVDLLVEREERPGHGFDQAREPGRFDERRGPAHRVRTVGVAGSAAATRALAQERDHRATRGQLDRPNRDAAQPAHALADAVDLARAGRDQPAQHVADGNGLRVGAAATRQRHRAVPRPTRARRARGCEQLRELIAGRRRGVAARSPCDDAARLPRDLDFDHPGFAIALVDDISVVGAGANVARVAVGTGRAGVRLRPLLAGLARPRVGQPSVLRLEVGDDLLAFFTAERARDWQGAPPRREGARATMPATRPDRRATPRVVRAWPRRRSRRRRTCRTAMARVASTSAFLSQISAGYEGGHDVCPSKNAGPKAVLVPVAPRGGPSAGNPAPPRQRNVDMASTEQPLPDIVGDVRGSNGHGRPAAELGRTRFSARGLPGESGPRPSKCGDPA